MTWRVPGMKLARKITIGLTLTIFVVMAFYAWFLIRGEVMLYEGDLEEDAQPRAVALRAVVQEIYRTQGPGPARDVVERIVDVLENVDVRWVDLDAARGDEAHVELSEETVRSLRDGTFVSVVTWDENGAPRRLSYVPMEPGSSRVLEVTRFLHREVSFIRTTRLAILVTTAAVVLACGATALLLGYWFVGRPIRLVRDKARRAGAGDFSGRLQLKQRDEVGELAEEIDQMCDRIAETNQRLTAETEAKLSAIERMRHAERLASVGRFASGVAHELGTPLNVVAARAKMIMANELAGSQTGAHARVISDQAVRMTEMIRQLLDLSRRRSSRVGTANLTQVAKTVAEMLEPIAAERGVATVVETPDRPLLVRLDPGEAQQVLTNVALNAIQASPAGCRVRLSIDERRTRPPAAHGGPESEYICIAVEDQGEGIAREDLPHVFEPFFTTKGPGEGTGLGLAIAEGIVEDGGGWIEVESERGRGTRFSICVPPAAQIAAAARAGGSP